MSLKDLNEAEISAISTLKLVGYLWYSDQTDPKILSGEVVDFAAIAKEIVPFVVEGMLYYKSEEEENDNKEVSIRIQNLDGEGHIYIIDLLASENLDSEQLKVEHRAYPAHRMKNSGTSYKNLKFKEAFQRTEDVLNPGFYSWQPTWRAFVGFC